MSEELPPTPPSPPPADPPPPSPGFCAFLGFLLAVFGAASGMASLGVGFFVGLVVAFGSLFFEGYRYIFVGYLLTHLIAIGLFILAIIVICGSGSSHPM
jgi:hypothetical protein